MTQTTSQRFVRSGQHAAVHALVALQLFTGIAQAAELTPTTGGVTLDQAANGVPIVNIAKPNGAGISHNRYSRFNVGAQGLILNNSAQPVNTQLGGYITGNANLGAGSARLILNEVTAANPSQLKGYMEVAGQRAGVVVANPYGITCDGCGFINTSRATLATGTPRWRSDGTLERFDVQQGVLRIEGAGLNADNTDGLALYARTLELNAALYANALEVVTGANSIDAETGVATAQAGTGVVPAYAIDSSMLGGMYAGTITLVGTEAGVGMRLAAPVAALTGQLEIRNNGDVRLVRTSAQSDMTVQAQGGVELAALTTVGGDATFTVEGVLNNRSLVEVTGNLQLTAGELSNANGTLQAGRNLTLNLAVFDRAQSGGRIAAGEQLTLQTVGDIRFNGDEFATPGALSVLSLAGDILIDSRVVAGGDTVLRSQQLMLGETAVLVGQGALSIAAQDMTNQGIVYGRDRLTLQVENVLTNGGGETLPAALLSEGDIHIARADGGMLSALDNVASQIESRNGAIEITAEKLRNINLGWSTRSYDLAPTYTYTPNAGTWANYYGTGISGTSGMHAYRYQRITRHHEVEQGMRGNIVAAGDITIAATTVENDRSTISAGDHLEITADNIYNTGTELTDTTRVMLSDRWHTCEKHTDGNTTCNNHEAIYRRADEPGDTVVIPAVIEGRTVTLKGNVGVVNCSPGEAGEPGSKCTGVSPGGSLGGMTGPWATTPLAQPGTLLPASGLFQLNHDPNHPYLIETDPALNTYTGFLGSAYLLSHLDGWAPDMTQRRLGDSYYELMLIREALLASTGSRFLDPAIADEKAQFEYLMQNAIAASEALHLSPGIALSREQIDALQSDIVWMEERVVADQKVLVPVVYLAQGSSRLLREGSVIGGGSLAVEAGSFVNTGLLRAEDNLLIRAEEDLLNRTGSLQAGGTLIAQSGGDFRNESGQLSGENVLVLAGGDITHQTDSEGHAWQAGAAASTYTNVGATASVTASGQVVQIAGGDIRLQGAAVSGDNVAMVAGGDIAMETERVEQSRSFSGADWQMAEEQVRHLQTEVEALNEIRLVAGADLEAIAASLRADETSDWARVDAALQELRSTGLAPEGDIALTAARVTAGSAVSLTAGGSLHLLAAEESDHYEVHSQDNGTFSDKSFDTEHDESRLLGTHIDAGGRLNLEAKGDITLYASTAAAKGVATVEAGGTINLIAGVNTTQHSVESRKSTDATFNNHSEGYLAQEAAASGLYADGDITLNAGGNINLIASELSSKQTLRIGSSEVDQAALAMMSASGVVEGTEKLPLNLHVGTMTLINESWNETQKGFSGPLEELVKVASVATAFFTTPYTLGQVDFPEIKLSEYSSTRTQDVWQAGSTLTAQDMAIRVQDTAAFVGAQVIVPGMLAVTAKDIVIDAAAETHSVHHEEGNDTVKGLGAEFSKDKGEYRVAGLQETKTSVSDSQQITEWRGTRIDAGNLVLNAEQDIDILGSQLNVIGEAAINAGGDLTVGGREGSVTQQHRETTETITVAVAVRNAYHDAVQAVEAIGDAKEALQAAKDALDEAERKVALGQLASGDIDFFRVNVAAAAANLAQATIGTAGALANAAQVAAGSVGTGFYMSGNAQHDTITTTSSTTQTVWQGSTLAVGGNALLTAGNTLQVKGSEVAAKGMLALEADTIAITAGAEHFSQSSKTTESHESVGVSVTPTTISANVGISGRETDADSSATHYVNSRVSAGTLISRSDVLRVAGAQVTADDVDIETRELIVASLQDESHSQSKTQGGSLGMSFGYGSGSMSPTSVSGGIEQSKSSSDSRWVAEQTQIIGFNSIRVRAIDTVLTGAVIANAEIGPDGQLTEKGNLDFATETLAFHDLQDYQFSKTTGINFSTTLNTSAFRPGVGGEARGQTTFGGQYFGHETERVNRATLGAGSIVVGGQRLTEENADALGLSGINRDLSRAQEVTRDQDIGGLNASVSVDNRWFAEGGPADIFNDLLSVPENAKKTVAGASRDLLRVTATHSAYEVMFTKDAKMYVLLYDENGNVLTDKETGLPMRREITDEEKANLVRSSDGKVYIANNGINNDQDGAAKYANQHGISENQDGKIQIVQHFIEFQKADNMFAELVVAFYQKNIEGDFWGLTNPTQEVKDMMLDYGKTGLHLDGHSRGSMTIGNAMRSLLNDGVSVGQLGGITVNLFGPAFNVKTADEMLSVLQSRDSYPESDQEQMTLHFQNHKFDPVGMFVGWNPSSGGDLPEDKWVVLEMGRALLGKEFTTHNCYGNGEAACGVLWDGSKPNLIPVERN